MSNSSDNFLNIDRRKLLLGTLSVGAGGVMGMFHKLFLATATPVVSQLGIPGPSPRRVVEVAHIESVVNGEFRRQPVREILSQDDTFANKVAQTIDAARRGDKETIQTLLLQDISLANIKDEGIQSTPLHFAAHRGYLDIVRLLLDAGADVNAVEGNFSNSTPLHWAATGGHLEVTKLLVESGGNLNVKDNWYNLTPVGWATIIKISPPEGYLSTRHQEVREYLLSRGAQLDVFSAIALNKIDFVGSLIEANPEILTYRLGFFAKNESQPLHFAVEENLTQMVELLLEKGAELNAQNGWGITPLCLATVADNQTIIELLMAKNAQVDLATAIVAGQWEQAQALLDAQPTLISEKPLLIHYTIQQGLGSATSWLLERGVDINIRARYQLGDHVASLTPLHAAIKAERVEIARILLESGADVNAKTIGELEITSLRAAAFTGNLDLIRLLVKHGA